MAKILYKNPIEYENASNDQLLKNSSFEKDHTGQVIIYTGIYAWADGSFRSSPEKTEEDNSCTHDNAADNEQGKMFCADCGTDLGSSSDDEPATECDTYLDGIMAGLRVK